MTKSYAGGLHTLMVNDIETPAVLALIWKTNQSPALRALLVHCQDAFTDPPGYQPLPSGCLTGL